ncbi:MBOAT family O-acyltransferase [Actinopolymorpha sp. B11F2]|uniref:MBOAT family O-acyltransferase n=1 Tax=Actinopolymorpha sp. B11F2 TaxID=3160862 RepID=UPI0032E43D19
MLLASGFFYLWGAGGQIAVILVVALVSFAGARAIIRGRQRNEEAHRDILIITTLVILATLTPLFIVKYLPVLLNTARDLGLGSVAPVHIALPLGVSFFTFHAISFVVDVLRRSIPPGTSLRDYLLYLFLFPHQIAGPIVRYDEIRTEIENHRVVTTRQAAYGCTRFAWGLAKKACIADPCGRVADAVFAQSDDLSTPAAWLGAVAYAIQIYFDFSGYSDMAIGLAALFGFHFPENFAAPYRSHSVTEFWRSWHMTLSRWFRDYVYIPLGGSRHGPRREYAALLLTFLLTALWHGASGTFLLWGALHSLALVVERLTGLRYAQRWRTVRRVALALFVIFSWVVFRSPSLDAATDVWGAMLSGDLRGLPPGVLVVMGPWQWCALSVGLAAFIGPWQRTWFQTLFGIEASTTGIVRGRLAVAATPALLLAAVVAVIWLDFSPFLYFQF